MRIVSRVFRYDSAARLSWVSDSSQTNFTAAAAWSGESQRPSYRRVRTVPAQSSTFSEASARPAGKEPAQKPSEMKGHLSRHRRGLPDLGRILADGPIRGEFPHLRDVQDRHPRPLVLVEERLAHARLAVEIRLEIREEQI